MKKEFEELLYTSVLKEVNKALSLTDNTLKISNNAKEKTRIICNKLHDELRKNSKKISIRSSSIMILSKNGLGELEFDSIRQELIDIYKDTIDSNASFTFIFDLINELKTLEYQFIYSVAGVKLGLILDEFDIDLLEKQIVTVVCL